MDRITERIKDCLKDVPEYVAGKSIEEVKQKYRLNRVVKLASNENPYGASKKAIKAFREFGDFHIYPKTDFVELREKIAEYVEVNADRIVLGAGMDGVLENIFKMFLNAGDEVIISIPSFPYYHTLTKIHCAKDVQVNRGEDFTMNVDAVLDKTNEKTKIIIVCSPNNPTGNVESREDIKRLIEETDALVFIDEAYVEFSDNDLMDLVDYENIVVARTFSKAFALANLRIGYAVMHEDLRKEYMKVSTPFPLSTSAVNAAIAALDDLEYTKRCIKLIVEERERLMKELSKFFKVYPSQANFLFVKSGVKAKTIAEELMKRGVIVRDCSNFIGCDEYSLRISVGRKEDNDFLLEALDDLKAEGIL
ncbi:histidinol-phosphate transaminase [Archaeoglobales archaeon]|nr:MAG: histidinol-phosphate transaminase [Archaeoglobales archaeon]